MNDWCFLYDLLRCLFLNTDVKDPSNFNLYKKNHQLIMYLGHCTIENPMKIKPG